MKHHIFSRIFSGAVSVLLGGFGLFGFAACSSSRLCVLEDVRGDGHGPGGYRLPEHPVFSAGAFDLTRLSFGPDGDDWIFEVEFADRVRSAEVFLTRDERRSLHPQTVDIYLRLDAPGPARQEALPGRRLAFEPGRGWLRAVVLSPVPRMLSRVLSASTDLAEQVCIPDRVSVRGRKLRARVSGACLGPWPIEAVAVAVSATRFVTSFEVVDGRNKPEALVMPVGSASGECRLDEAEGLACQISGCDPCGGHPQVLDVLDPAEGPPADLGDYDPEQQRLARIPWIPLSRQPAMKREASHGRSGSEGSHQTVR